jgi:hypothetical protein
LIYRCSPVVDICHSTFQVLNHNSILNHLKDCFIPSNQKRIEKINDAIFDHP